MGFYTFDASGFFERRSIEPLHPFSAIMNDLTTIVD